MVRLLHTAAINLDHFIVGTDSRGKEIASSMLHRPILLAIAFFGHP
jgi:hypothetical protein